MRRRCAVILGVCLALPWLPACPRGEPTISAERPVAPGSWAWELPPGFPTPLVPEDNPLTAAKIKLGRHLFYDARLSRGGDYACASCHRQELAFTDGRERALGSTGELHPRSSMSLANVAYNASLTWADPYVRRLERQALVPMFNEEPVELGLSGAEELVLSRFRSDPRYRAMFREAFPDDERPITLENVARALASFERTLISGGSAYDRLVYRGEMDALSESARRGMRLFYSSELGCSGCHAGFNFSGPIVAAEAPEIGPTFHNTGLYNVGGSGAYPDEDQGLYRVTGRPGDRGRFRAPSLRNVALTAPYMHDGSVATLDEVLRLYGAGGRLTETGAHAGDGRANPNKSKRITGFRLDATAQADLIAFLVSLTDEGFVTDPRFSDPFDPTLRADTSPHDPRTARMPVSPGVQARSNREREPGVTRLPRDPNRSSVTVTRRRRCPF
jgi:cytochrome c peroxidase